MLPIIYYTFLQTLRLHTRVISKINGKKYSIDISQQFMRGGVLIFLINFK